MLTVHSIEMSTFDYCKQLDSLITNTQYMMNSVGLDLCVIIQLFYPVFNNELMHLTYICCWDQLLHCTGRWRFCMRCNEILTILGSVIVNIGICQEVKVKREYKKVKM